MLTIMLYLNLLEYDQISSDLPQKSYTIFGYLRKYSAIFRSKLCSFWTIFGEPSKIFGFKWSENFRKSSTCLYNKQNNTLLPVGMEYLFSCSSLYLTNSLLRYQVEYSEIFHMYMHPCIILDLYNVGHELACYQLEGGE